MNSISSLGEFGMIEQIKRLVPVGRDVVLGIGDDTAVLPLSKKHYQLFTTDMMAQDVHFTTKMDPLAVGHKAIACNISDIASMGGQPTNAVVSIGIPGKTSFKYVESLYKGMAKTAKAFGVSIVGGDSIKCDQIVINIALLGQVRKTHLVTRAGAKPSDWIFVTGPLGGSFKSKRHLTFMPRVEEAQFLTKYFKPSAMIDISDGLAGDLNHILQQSKVGAKLWPDAVPLNAGCRLENALNDGEDYELLFTLDAKQALKLMHWQYSKRAFYFYPIGEIVSNRKQKLHASSYTHY